MIVFLLLLVIVLVIDWFAAKAMYEIAVMKGHPQKKYFWWCFWIAVFGYLMVIALPDRCSAQAIPSADELPDL